MIRPGKMADIVRIRELFIEMHAASKYAGVVEIDLMTLQKALMTFMMRNGHTNDGGCIVTVSEDDGVVEGFMVGMLDRIYHIGDKFSANDIYLYASPRCSPLAVGKMIDAYLAWAQANPKVHEIALSWSDALPFASRMAKVYERKGFSRCGEIFERAANV